MAVGDNYPCVTEAFCLFFVNVTSFTQIQLIIPSLHISPRPLQPPQKEKTNKQKSHYGSCSDSWYVIEYTCLPKQFYLQMFTAMSHWSGSGSLASAILSKLETSPGLILPVSWRSCRFGSAGLAPPHSPAVHCWG